MLTREVAPETLVSKVSVAEGRFEGGLTRDPATGMPVAGIAVAKSRVTSAAAAGCVWLAWSSATS